MLAEVDDHRLPSGASTGAREFGTTDIIDVRGDEAAAAVRELTDGVGADAVLERVGTNDAMATAQHARPGSTVGYVGVPHGIEIGGPELFFRTSASRAALRPSAPTSPNSSRTSSRAGSTRTASSTSRPTSTHIADAYAAMDERRIGCRMVDTAAALGASPATERIR